MKHFCRKILLLSILLTVSTVSAIEVSLIASNAINVPDIFSGLLPARTPAIPEISKVRPGHRFNIYFLLSKFQTRKGKAHVTGSLYLKSADKKIEIFNDQELFYGDCASPSAINLSNLVANWDFNNEFPAGRYSFVLEAKDMINGKTSIQSIDIKLIKTAPEPLKITTKDIRGFISSFYKAPQPERLLELFNIFLAGDKAARKQKNYSPLPLLYGMARCIEYHQWIWRDFATRSYELEGDHKKYLALLFAAAGDQAMEFMIRKADRKTAGYIKQMKENNPWVFTEPYLEHDINAFWMEFYFTGKSDSILKIANQLRNRPTMSVRQAKERKGELSPAEKIKVSNYYSASSAAWSINTHASQHNLVFFYLESMLERGKFADVTTATKIQKILSRAAVHPTVIK